MAAEERLPVDMDQLLSRFPGESVVLARLLAVDDGFRNVCEDYALAEMTLARLERFQGPQELPRIAEYRQLVRELAGEIAKAIESAKHTQ
jgi:hypothetical protein